MFACGAEQTVAGTRCVVRSGGRNSPSATTSSREPLSLLCPGTAHRRRGGGRCRWHRGSQPERLLDGRSLGGTRVESAPSKGSARQRVFVQLHVGGPLDRSYDDQDVGAGTVMIRPDRGEVLRTEALVPAGVELAELVDVDECCRHAGVEHLQVHAETDRRLPDAGRSCHPQHLASGPLTKPCQRSVLGPCRGCGPLAEATKRRR